MTTRFNDIVTTLNPKRIIDHNGFAQVPAVISRVGVQQYREDQLGLGLSGSKLVNVFRPPETVFHADTIDTFAHLPVTDQHPPRGVTPKNAGLVQGGHTGEDVSKINDKDLGVTLHLTDQVFISKSKGSQTSAGYDAEIIRDSGEFEGQKYEYRFDGAMIGNHLALVPAARCGEACRVLDENNPNKEKRMEAQDLQEVQKMIDTAITKSTEAQAPVIADAITTALTKHQDGLDAKKADAQKILDDAAQLKLDEEAGKTEKAQIIADAKTSAELRLKLKPLLADKFDDSKTDKELLDLTFADRVEKPEDKSQDYLLALLDQETETREKGGKPLLDAGSLAVVGAVKVQAIK